MTEELINKVNFLTYHAHKTLTNLGGKTEGNLKIYSALALTRLYYVTNSLSLLMEKYQINPSHEFGMYVILRPAMLDTLSTLHIFAKKYEGKLNDADIEEICFSYLADGLQRVVDSVSNDHGRALIDGDKYEKFCKQIVNQYKPFFENGNDRQKPKVVEHTEYSAAKLCKEVRQYPESQKLAADIYNRYDLYSKYDHFTLLHFGFESISNEDKARQLDVSIQFVSLHSHMLHKLINNIYNSTFFQNQLEEVNNFYGKHYG